MIDLNGKRALVTGGGTRLGREFALALGTVGCNVAVHYHTNQHGAASTAAEIQKSGGDAAVFQADFRDSAAPSRLAKEVLHRLGGLDILINNASSWPSRSTVRSSGGMLNETPEDFDMAMAINCRAPFFLMQHFSPTLRENSGIIINILDRAASFPYLSRASYSVSKSAMLAASKLASKTFGPEIRVNCLELGPILPPDEMSREEAASLTWAGTESAVNGLLFILLNQVGHGETVSLHGNVNKRKQL